MKAIYCPVTGVNLLRLFLASLATFVFVYVSDFVLHGILLADIYQQTPDLWRPQEEMMSYMPWMIIFQALFSVAVALAYALFCQKEDCLEGLKFGSVIGAIVGLTHIGAFIYMPISMELGLYWFAGLFVQVALAGAISGLIYKKG